MLCVIKRYTVYLFCVSPSSPSEKYSYPCGKTSPSRNTIPFLVPLMGGGLTSFSLSSTTRYKHICVRGLSSEICFAYMSFGVLGDFGFGTGVADFLWVWCLNYAAEMCDMSHRLVWLQGPWRVPHLPPDAVGWVYYFQRHDLWHWISLLWFWRVVRAFPA